MPARAKEAADHASRRRRRIYGKIVDWYETKQEITRTTQDGVKSAMAFGMYFPNPALFGSDDVVSIGDALFVEAWGTAVLMFMILALTDPRNRAVHERGLAPFFIGFTIAVLIGLYAPLTQVRCSRCQTLSMTVCLRGAAGACNTSWKSLLPLFLAKGL